MTVIAAVRGELPEHRYTQAEVTEALLAMPGFSEHADSIRQCTRVRRSTAGTWCLPLEDYAGLTDFGARQRRLHRARRGTGMRRGRWVRSTTPAWSPSDVDLHHDDDGDRAGRADASTRGSPAGSGCDRTCGGCRCSGWVAWQARRGRPGCTTTCAAIPTAWRCCWRSNCARWCPKTDPSMATRGRQQPVRRRRRGRRRGR